MGVTLETKPPPESSDLKGWRHAVRARCFLHYRLEVIVAAIQDLGPGADSTVINPLAEHLSASLHRILRRNVRFDLPNIGRDIIEETHGKIIEAILRPTSADGQALRVAFVPRVMFRIRNAIALELRASGNRTRKELDELENDQLIEHDPVSTLDECIDVERLLSDVAHERKRLAFRLFMDGIPFTSKLSTSIVQSLGISENTARSWVREVRELLSSFPAVQEMHAVKYGHQRMRWQVHSVDRRLIARDSLRQR